MEDTKRMDYNLELMIERILDTNRISNLEKIKEELSKIKGGTFCVGAGGSRVVSDFACKILNFKNNCITNEGDISDLLSVNLEPYENVFVCSYSGKNEGVDEALKTNLKGYILTSGDIRKKDTLTNRYLSSIPRERSFISLGATLMPMSILLNYYLDGYNFENLVHEIFNNIPKFSIQNDDNFHIFTNMGTSTCATYLDSTLVEAGLGRPVLHHKYDYCHGRSTLLKNYCDSILFSKGKQTDLNDVILDATNNYKQKIVLSSNYNDIVIDNFNLTIQAIYLTVLLARIKEIDLSKVDYDKDAVPKLYKFKGSM